MSKSLEISTILLAAGMSRRMGQANKLLLPFGDSTIFETTLKHILAADLDEIIVVLGHESEKILPILKSYPPEGRLSICLNSDYKKGMTSSIQAGVRCANEASKGYMICLSDMPLIRPETYNLLKNSFLEYSQNDQPVIVRPKAGDKFGNPTIFSHHFKNDILNLSPDDPETADGCRKIVLGNAAYVKSVEVNTPLKAGSVFQDADTPEAYQKLLDWSKLQE